MAVYLPTAALGNGRLLVTIGGTGELMGLFYPHLDDAQNIRQGMPAFLIEEDGEKQVAWTFDDIFSCTQDFDGSSGILVTHVSCPAWKLSALFTDLVVPEETAFLRRIQVQCRSRVAYGHYFDFNVGGIGYQNAVHYLPDRKVLVQGRREIFIAVAVSLPFSHQCGKVQPDGDSITKWDFARGELSNQEQDIGDVDFALWVPLPQRGDGELVLAVTCDTSEDAAVEKATDLVGSRFGDVQARAIERDRSWLAPKTALEDEEFARPFQRALLSLRALHDETTGAILAAPEFDPTYEQCGGYGYVWPRDGCQAALSLARAGDLQMPAAFFRWCARTQLPDGHWYQRYWTMGDLAPSWCIYADFFQLDQTASVLHGLCRFARMLPDDERSPFLSELAPMASRAVEALRGSMGSNGLHLPAADLWERLRGSFTYTNAAIYGALRAAAEVLGLDTLAEAQRIRAAIFDHLWLEDEGRFGRGIGLDGRLDPEADSSILGTIDPFDLLNLEEETDAARAASVIEWVEAQLTRIVPLRGRGGAQIAGRDGAAILRYRADPYLGGAAGSVNTLWMARAHLRLAAAEAKMGKVSSAEGRMRVAREYIRTALAYATPCGQLGELLLGDGNPWWWAAPHAWASALFVDCVLLLREYRSELRMEN